jgi:hypothetical protein
MCNCGNKRETFSAKQTMILSGNQNFSKHGSKTWPDINFEYAGKTALTVRGNISGKNYRFSAPGDVQLIDYRDASSLMAVPVLKKLL